MRAASARVQSHPPTPTPPKQINPGPDRPSFKSTPEAPAQRPGRRRTASQAPPGPPPQAPEPAPGAGAGESPTPSAPAGTHGTEKVENDPLVQTVLGVFGGEIKRVHPKNP